MSERTRSFWGWGWADRFPDIETRRGLGAMVAALLGVEPPEPREPPALASVVLPGARVAPPGELAAFASAAHEDRVRHTYGRSYRDLVRGFRGEFGSAPDFVLYPRDEADVASALAWCTRQRVALVPYGGGTSVVAGVEPAVADGYHGVVSLDLRRLDRVLEVDAVSLAARIQAGAMGPALEAQLAPHGLSLRHYPQSFEFSTLGGWIATRAGGHFATLYTHIDELVESVRMVTPTGTYASRRLPASGAGPSPDRWVIGSEGALGVITEAWVRLQRRPRFRASASARFDDFARAVEAARAVGQSGLFPANCRLLDPAEAQLNGVADDGRAVLLLGFESADHALGPWIERALELCRALGAASVHGPVLREDDAAAGVGSDTDAKGGASGGRARDASSWREAFVNAPYLQTALVSLGLVVDTFETACTWDRFAELHAAVNEAVTGAMARACGGGRLTCRFTHVYPDGPAPYYTFVAPGRAGDELAQWEAIKRAASDALAAHGATITHHHAVGRLHRPWYDRERPEVFARALAASKREVDPAWVMNPGVLVDR